jgi:glucose-6-phosphate isomerase
MRVDIGNALSSVTSPGVSRDALERLDARVANAHDRIERGRDRNEPGYAALSLPESVDLARVRATADLPVDPEAVVLAGIGGSALGAATLVRALGAGTKIDVDVDVYTLDNVDPAETVRILDAVDLDRTALVCVSRSGTTAETLANVLTVRGAYEDADVDWTDRTLVVTGDDGPLRSLADRHGLATLPTPEGVPGRFGVFSTVGLAPAALAGVDVTGLVEGAREAAGSLTGSMFDCPGYAYGTVAYALRNRGAAVNAVMPYAESLETFAEWFAQLWAESLGKDGLGQTPARALGATDQHSQLQLYRAGPQNTMVTFVRPRERPACSIPSSEFEALSYLEGVDQGELLDAELRATEASLAEAGRPSVRVEMDRVNAHSLGELLYGMEAACVCYGELAGINAFDQPAVEWAKRATRGLLGATEETAVDAADRVAEKREFVVE